MEESDTEFRVGELAVGEHLLLTLSEHNRLYYNNGFSCALALSLLSLVILCPCVLCFSLYRKAKAKAAERFARYHCEAIKLPYTPERRHADLKDDVMSKETFVFEISLIIGLFVLFFVLLLVGILLELAMTAVLVAALSSLAISLILLFTQYKALRRYEIVSAVGKLYRSGITKASLSYTRGTLTERLLFCGYLQKSPAVFESTGRAYSEGRTEMNYRALFYTENELHTFAESLKTPSPKQRLATHTLLFVFLDGKEDAALHDTLLVLERSLMNGTYSVTPVLLTPTAVYLPRLTLMQAPSMEAEFLLGLW